jgi:hypothetical protein
MYVPVRTLPKRTPYHAQAWYDEDRLHAKCSVDFKVAPLPETDGKRGSSPSFPNAWFPVSGEPRHERKAWEGTPLVFFGCRKKDTRQQYK